LYYLDLPLNLYSCQNNSIVGQRDGEARVQIEYEGEKSNWLYYKVHRAGAYNAACPQCDSKREETVAKLRESHRNSYENYQKQRAICLTCIQTSAVPRDPISPDTPETCTLKTCKVYEERETLVSEAVMYERNLKALGAVHDTW
jgi:hypothetical protein